MSLAPLLAATASLLQPIYHPPPSPPFQLRWAIGGEPLALAADPQFAGAISSLRYRGREYLDAHDHGRELQGAVTFGRGECLNPTLAGASSDRPGTTGSRLLSQSGDAHGYASATRMAFWNRPGERCLLAPGVYGRALNATTLSDVVYRQRMTPGYAGQAHAVLDRVELDSGSDRPPASVEALTGYMPVAFDTLWTYDAGEGRFERDRLLEREPGERDAPVVLSTTDGSAALGAVALGGEGRATYAGYVGPLVSKWSVVFRAEAPFARGAHRYTCVWAIGTRAEVAAALSAVMARQEGRSLARPLAVAALLLAAGLGIWAGAELRRRRRRPPQPL